MKPLRVWPGVPAVVMLWLLFFGVPAVAPEWTVSGMLGGIICAALVLIWWLFFSRAPWIDRFGAVAAIVVATIAAKRVVHISIAGGAMGMMTYALAIPVMPLVLVASAVAARRQSSGRRRVSLAAGILLGVAALALVRTDGVRGGGKFVDAHWRWTPTAEERLLAKGDDAPTASVAESRPVVPAIAPAKGADTPRSGSTAAPVTAPAAAAATVAIRKDAAPRAAIEDADANVVPEWPGFRGPARDDVVHGVRINTDWTASPPVQLWRRPIGPGWSSFAVQGGVLFTQEQRGDDEIVSAYKVATGEPVWRHRDRVRFYESNGGAGPRATPTLSRGRVYSFGATGILNALDARSGAVVWSHNASADTQVAVPGWGFSSSPVVMGDLVIVAASGRLAGYDAATGRRRWLGPAGGGGYSSPHPMTIDGVPQIVLQRGARTISVAPSDGTLLWEHVWEPSASIVQPAQIANGDLIVTTADAMGGLGIRRLAIAQGSHGWSVQERWTSRGLKPYFNDYVVHKGHVYGFDGAILSCVDLEDGARKWKGGRYGNGQLLLLADQDVLLVMSEEGELALVSATPDKFTELARMPALDGKTWNHPVVVGDVLLVRNGEEMAAFRLSPAGISTSDQR